MQTNSPNEKKYQLGQPKSQLPPQNDCDDALQYRTLLFDLTVIMSIDKCNEVWICVDSIYRESCWQIQIDVAVGNR